MISNPYHSGFVCFQNCEDWEDYTIREKDTLYNISVRFGVPIRMLMTCNRLLNPYNLKVGQVIKVPSSKPELLCCKGDDEETYVIQLKDTLYSIAEKYDTSVEAILEKNPGVDPYNLKPGAPICVPKKHKTNSDFDEKDEVPALSAPLSDLSLSTMDNTTSLNLNSNVHHDKKDNFDCKSYTVKPGDTLSSILESFGFTYAAMAIANQDKDLTDLTEGMKICIPLYDMFKGCGSGTTYIIKSGDSIPYLAERFNVTQAELLSANPFVRPADFSSPGNRICIPE